MESNLTMMGLEVTEVKTTAPTVYTGETVFTAIEYPELEGIHKDHWVQLLLLLYGGLQRAPALKASRAHWMEGLWIPTE